MVHETFLCSSEHLLQSIGQTDPEGPVPSGKKVDLVYLAACPECDEEYVGETHQPLARLVNQHAKSTSDRAYSAKYVHMAETGHNLSLDNFRVLDRESD